MVCLREWAASIRRSLPMSLLAVTVWSAPLDLSIDFYLEITMFKTAFSFLLVCGLLPAQIVTAQAGAPAGDGPNPPQNFTFATPGLAMPGARAGAIGVIAHEFSYNSGKPVTGAPYSGDEVTEHVQTLSDGNRIVNTTSTRIYRDSQGRTRTETTLPTFAGGPSAPVMITINDPVSGVTYLLNADNKTAQKLMAKQVELPKAKGLLQLPDVAVASGAGSAVFTAAAGFPKPDMKTEDLGNQTLDGVLATGTRTTETIPAGAVGNEQPIQIVSERWFSHDLQVAVKSTISDPRIGQTTETLNNLTRTEPDSSLFQVPGDYSVTDSKIPAAKTFFFKQEQ
jgi:hypothetical protein